MTKKINWRNPEEAKEYYASWRLQNPEKVRAYNRKHYLENKAKIIARSKKYHESHGEKTKEWSKRYREKNREARRRYVETHREEITVYGKEYSRQHYLTVGGKRFRVNKRIYYGICEMHGGLIEKRPRWHHWNNEHLEWGLWLCYWCHNAVEASEQKGIVIPLYSKLKELIESS